MYPDTDSAPIPIDNEFIERQRKDLPPPIHYRLAQLEEWEVPHDTYHYILKRNLAGLIEKINEDFDIDPKFVGTLIGHALRRIEGANSPSAGFDYRRVYDLFAFVEERKLDREIVKKMLPVVYEYPNMDFDSVLTTIDFAPMSKDEILLSIPVLNQKFDEINTSSSPQARLCWIMGNLRKLAVGNISLAALKSYVEKEIAHG
jgi:glutamyl-tRNA(Gln) amidotransferase subunit E